MIKIIKQIVATTIFIVATTSISAQIWSAVPGFNLDNGTIVRLVANEDSLIILGGFILEGSDSVVCVVISDSTSINPWGLQSEWGGGGIP